MGRSSRPGDVVPVISVVVMKKLAERLYIINYDPRLFTIKLWQVQQGDDPLKSAWRGK